MIEMKGLLVGESARACRSRRDRRRPVAGPGVREIVHLKTQHIGPDETSVAAKVEFDRRLTFEQLTESIDATEALVRAAVPAARLDLPRTRPPNGVEPR